MVVIQYVTERRGTSWRIPRSTREKAWGVDGVCLSEMWRAVPAVGCPSAGSIGWYAFRVGQDASCFTRVV